MLFSVEYRQGGSWCGEVYPGMTPLEFKGPVPQIVCSRCNKSMALT